MTKELSLASTGARQVFQRIDAMLLEHDGQVLAELVDGPLSYGLCRATMLRLTVAFDRIGLRAGHRGMIMSHDDRQVITQFLAMLRNGIVPVIADPDATATECLELAQLCKVKVIFSDADTVGPNGVAVVRLGGMQGTSQSLVDILGDAPSPAAFSDCIDAQDVAMLVLTSGTTSTPKAVELTHSNLIAQMDVFGKVYGFGQESRLLNLLPLHHVDGLIRGPVAALWFGAMVDRWTAFSAQVVPKILQSILERRTTHFVSVPAMLRIIERVGRTNPTAFKTPTFRFVLSSADMLDAALWRRFEDTFGVPVANAYGLSEVACDALFAGPEPATRKIGTIGRPVGCEARVVDTAGRDVPKGEIGELVLSGPTVMRGYFDAPEETEAVLKDGGFHTGDYVRINAEGLFEFTGRKKTAIVSGGATIHPESATQALSAMPGVLEAVAFGVPDASMGERLVAALVPVDGFAISAADASAYCRSVLSPERTPREFHILTALPRTASGKVLLAEIQLPVLAPVRANVLEVAALCFNQPVEALSLTSTPFNTAGWDSLAHMALIESLEEAFGIQFSAMQIAQIMSLGDAERFINEELGPG